MHKLRVEHLSKDFGRQEGLLSVLHDVSFDLFDGEFLAVVGPSGCGKTTLLNIIGGLLKPTSGHVVLEDHVLKGPSSKISMIFQGDSLLPWKTVAGNVRFAVKAQGGHNGRIDSQVEEYLELVGLADFASYYPRQLSGGMRQRVALARALATDPEILLMDEPFSSLDPELRERLQVEVSGLHARLGRSTVFVSHDIDEVTFLAQRIVVLTERPGSICDIVNVDFPMPRSNELRISPAFEEAKRRLWKLLRGELGEDGALNSAELGSTTGL